MRVRAVLGGLLAGCLFLAVLSAWLSAPEPGQVTAGGILLDRASPAYPLTIQNVMWLLFFGGMGDVLRRFARGGGESRQVGKGLLPEDAETMLRARDLGAIYKRVRPTDGEEPYFLQRLIARVALQFQGSRSVDQSSTVLNSSLELMQHEIELKYNMIRYLVWLIPTLGFIGTVVGIALSLREAGNMPNMGNQEALREWLKAVTGSLALAFNTTMVALLLSAVLVFLLHLAQGREESALNRAGQYCLDNLINRLYEK